MTCPMSRGVCGGGRNRTQISWNPVQCMSHKAHTCFLELRRERFCIQSPAQYGPMGGSPGQLLWRGKPESRLVLDCLCLCSVPLLPLVFILSTALAPVSIWLFLSKLPSLNAPPTPNSRCAEVWASLDWLYKLPPRKPAHSKATENTALIR